MVHTITSLDGTVVIIHVPTILKFSVTPVFEQQNLCVVPLILACSMFNPAHVIWTHSELTQYPVRVTCEIHRQSYDIMSAEIASIWHEIQFQAADSLTGTEPVVNKWYLQSVLNLQADGEGKRLESSIGQVFTFCIPIRRAENCMRSTVAKYNVTI